MSESLLIPAIDEDSAPYWDGARQGELRMQRCAACAELRFPPRPMCPRCRSTQSTWPALSGRGCVWSFVVPHPPLLPQFAELSPYNVVVVALDEDPALRLIGNLVERAGGPINAVDPATIEIGEPVRAVFDRITDEIALPRWVRA